MDGLDRAAELPQRPRKGRSELFRALGVLLDPPAPEHARVAEALALPPPPDGAEHTTLFALNLYPYASVYLGAEGMMGGEARDRVAGFWRAVGLTAPAEADHLGALLGLLAALGERAEGPDATPAEAALLEQARHALLQEHLLPWAPFWLARVEELARGFYGAWARLLTEALLEAAGDAPATGSLPLHLREAPGLPDPRTGEAGVGEAFIHALLAPVRSGLILTRHDLARAGRERQLGVRLGERAYVLKALLAQDAAGTLAWLSGEARRQASRHQACPGDPAVVDFWRHRASAAAELLEALAAEEADPSPTTPRPRADLPTETHHA